MTALRAFLVLAAAVFAGVIVWAFSAAAFWESFGRISADPWGIVALADLSLGFLIASLVIAMSEERKAVAVGTIAALFVLGNVVTLLWAAWRLPRLQARLAGRPARRDRPARDGRSGRPPE